MKSRFVKPKFVDPNSDEAPVVSRHLYVVGVGQAMGTSKSALYQVFSQFGELDGPVDGQRAIEYIDGKRYCFVSFKQPEAASVALAQLNDKNIEDLKNAKIRLKYAIEATEENDPNASRSPPEPECTSTTEHVQVPGFQVIPDIITPEEEDYLLQGIGSENNSLWQEHISRRVQVRSDPQH